MSVNFFAQIVSSTGQMAGSPPNLHTMDPIRVYIHPGSAQVQGRDERSRDIIRPTFGISQKIANSVFP